MSDHDVVIAGGGIGGLTAAIALQRAGRSVLVLEQAPELRAQGAGITIQTNAMVVLRELGLEEELRAAGETLEGGAILDSGGKLIQDLRLDLQPAGLALHRERLLRCLAGACPAEVRYGARVVAYRAAADHVTLELSSGEAISARGLVGCDGLHSEVRRQMRGEEPLRYAGYTTWRGICRDVDAPMTGTCEVWGAGERFGIVPIGGGQVYWFAVAEAEAGGADGSSPTAELLERFAGWVEPVEALLRATADADVIRADTFDRPPIDRWTDGRVTLLGDAAHPMTPNLGQGAGQAIEDALALAKAVARHEDLPAAFAAYEECRRERANGFVVQSQRMGQLGQWRNPIARACRNAALRWTPGFVMRRSVERMYTPVVELPD